MPGIQADVLAREDSEFITILRAVAIMAIVFGHVGGFWVLKPYSEYLNAFVPVFFFVSGALSYYSFKRSATLSRYYTKRIVQLLVPYYLLCLLSLGVYIGQHLVLPPVDYGNLERWLTITPPNSVMPFPIGHIWFLHTLLIIILISPIYFYLFASRPYILCLLAAVMMISAILQSHADIATTFYISGNDFYKPFIQSIFFIFGIYVFANIYYRAVLLTVALCLSLTISIICIFMLHTDVDLGYHIIKPDIYYVATCISFIVLCVYAKPLLIYLYNTAISRMVFGFINRHILSIYLIHTFAIYVSEKSLGFENPAQKTIGYGLLKFVLVCALTFIMAPIFTWISRKLAALILDSFRWMGAPGVAR